MPADQAVGLLAMLNSVGGLRKLGGRMGQGLPDVGRLELGVGLQDGFITGAGGQLVQDRGDRDAQAPGRRKASSMAQLLEKHIRRAWSVLESSWLNQGTDSGLPCGASAYFGTAEESSGSGWGLRGCWLWVAEQADCWCSVQCRQSGARPKTMH